MVIITKTMVTINKIMVIIKTMAIIKTMVTINKIMVIINKMTKSKWTFAKVCEKKMHLIAFLWPKN